MEISSYLLMYFLYLVVLVGAAFFVFRRRNVVDEMHGMMVGMAFGMLSGLTTSAFFVLPTGNFLLGVMLGSFVGLVFGVLFGKLGGHLGVMEGVFAGPMGGMMGAMLGQMSRPFDVGLFVLFFSFVFLISVGGICYMVYCRVNCCSSKSVGLEKVGSGEIDDFFVVWFVVAVVLFLASFLLHFSIESGSGLLAVSNVTANGGLEIPEGLRQLVKEDKQDAVLRGDFQEVNLSISSSRYSPNVIVVKKGVLLRINARAEKNVGCANEILFPDFGIDEIIPVGGVKTIQFMPVKEGVFVFRCSMDMIKGKLVVQK